MWSGIPRHAQIKTFETLIDIVKPVNIERYTTTKIYLFELRNQSYYPYVVAVHSATACFIFFKEDGVTISFYYWGSHSQFLEENVKSSWCLIVNFEHIFCYFLLLTLSSQLLAG